VEAAGAGSLAALWGPDQGAGRLGTVVDQSDLGREVFVFQVNVGAVVQEVVSILNPNTVFGYGLCTEAILAS
jgi:hypothetical protein